MRILEHGQEQSRTLLFFPCTAEPVWAFEDTIALLSGKWHVFQVVYDGHQPEYAGDFTSVEQTVDAVTEYLRSRGVERLEEANVKNISLTNFDVVAEEAAEEGYIKKEDVARLVAFRNNPSDESWIEGAKK